jgi:hypothetical protein
MATVKLRIGAQFVTDVVKNAGGSNRIGLMGNTGRKGFTKE